MPTHSYDADPYYKILVPNPPSRGSGPYKNFFTICCVQDFDEYDYAQDEWLQDDEGVVSFDSLLDAQEYLAANVDPKWVRHEDRLIQNHVNQFR